MRVSISNIAWDVADDAAVARLLHRYGVDAIDVAPGKYFPDPKRAKDDDIIKVRDWWRECGVEIVGMQALLFGTTGLNVFGPSEMQGAMLEHLEAVCRIGSRLGASRLVFGSPRNRDRKGLSDRETADQANRFFRRLGDIAERWGVRICLEPNPSCYGANFMMTTAETAEVVRRIAHPCVAMQLDTGALTINGEAIGAVLDDCASLIGHIHASERNLVPLGSGEIDHAHLGEMLSAALPQHIVTVEMLTNANAGRIAALEHALDVAVSAYGLKSGGGSSGGKK